MSDKREKRVYVAPVLVFNSEAPDPMGVFVSDWREYVIKAADKVVAAFSLVNHPQFGRTIKAAGKFLESTLDAHPYARETGVVV